MQGCWNVHCAGTWQFADPPDPFRKWFRGYIAMGRCCTEICEGEHALWSELPRAVKAARKNIYLTVLDLTLLYHLTVKQILAFFNSLTCLGSELPRALKAARKNVCMKLSGYVKWIPPSAQSNSENIFYCTLPWLLDFTSLPVKQILAFLKWLPCDVKWIASSAQNNAENVIVISFDRTLLYSTVKQIPSIQIINYVRVWWYRHDVVICILSNFQMHDAT